MVEKSIQGGGMLDEEHLDRARAEFRELLRGDQQADPYSPASHVHPETVEELYELDREEVAARHDVLAEEARRIFSLNREESMLYRQLAQLYLDELRRRETVDQGKRMETLTESLNNLTWWIVVLTVVIAVATLLGVAPTAWDLLSAAWSVLSG
jgi:hypothetical protein